MNLSSKVDAKVDVGVDVDRTDSRMYGKLDSYIEPAHEIRVHHIGNLGRLRQSHQSRHCLHTWSMEVDEMSDHKSDIWPHWMAVHVP